MKGFFKDIGEKHGIKKCSNQIQLFTLHDIGAVAFFVHDKL